MTKYTYSKTKAAKARKAKQDLEHKKQVLASIYIALENLREFLWRGNLFFRLTSMYKYTDLRDGGAARRKEASPFIMTRSHEAREKLKEILKKELGQKLDQFTCEDTDYRPKEFKQNLNQVIDNIHEDFVYFSQESSSMKAWMYTNS